MRELYRSPNGDCWLLGRDPDSLRAFVRHEPNTASGGRPRDIDIGEFLTRDARHPQHEALLLLIGTLAEESDETKKTEEL
ncbi:MAG: hypothetical protein AB7H90_22180 [Alphaproteobacteria bacterium]